MWLDDPGQADRKKHHVGGDRAAGSATIHFEPWSMAWADAGGDHRAGSASRADAAAELGRMRRQRRPDHAGITRLFLIDRQVALTAIGLRRGWADRLRFWPHLIVGALSRLLALFADPPGSTGDGRSSPLTEAVQNTYRRAAVTAS